MAGENDSCPYRVGDLVRFTPSRRTAGLYQDVEGFGVAIGEVLPIAEIRDDCYLYFADGAGGWPWNEFSAVEAGTQISGSHTA